jgi:sirohydrochlorin ferrochelatase
MVSILAVGASRAVVQADHALVVKHETTFRTAFEGMLVSRAAEPCVVRRLGNRLRDRLVAVAPLHDGLARSDWSAW